VLKAMIIDFFAPSPVGVLLTATPLDISSFK
jgi:hypothetical protein